MASWRLVFRPSAERGLAALDPPIRKRVLAGLMRLVEDPMTAPNVTALTGGGHRMRVGDWRVVYSLDHGEVIVLVLRVGHRREVYR